jgi:PAS domain S-box-containing protein
MKFPVKNWIMLGFIVSVLALALTGWLSYRAITHSTFTSDSVVQAQEVIANLESVLAALTQVEAEQRGYLLTGQTNFLADLYSATERLQTDLTTLRRLTADNPKQQVYLDQLQPMIAQRLAFLDERIAVYQQRGLEAAADPVVLTQGKAVMDQIRGEIARMHEEEARLLKERLQLSRQSTRQSIRIITGGTVLAIGIGLLAVLIIQRDLRLRARAERELAENQRLLESILDHTPALVFLKDLAGRYLFVNRRFAQVAGRSRAEIRGQTVFDLAPEALAETAQKHQQTVLARQGPVEFEETVLYPDGPRSHLAVKFPLRDAEGKIYATAGISTDITERKRAEDERDRFFTLSLDLLCIASADGYFKRVSPAVQEILGWTPEEFLARPYLDFIHPDDHAATLQEVEKQVKAGQRVLQFENRYRHKDGSWRVLSWCSMPHGELMYAIARDMTEKNAAATQIAELSAEQQRRAAQLEAVNKELEAFSYSVSHDLRAPLRHIDGFVDLLRKQSGDKLDERSRRYLQVITDAAHQMGNLIDDLLVFSRMGRAELRQQTVDLAALVHEAVATLQSETNGRHITWKIAPLPQVQADAAMLRQVWVNLIANAVKYSRPRDPAVIEIGCAAETPVEYEFFVRDNGVGFDMEYVDKLFGVFQRLHRAEEFEGTGIGLANVRRIVLRHGGRTWAEGKVDAGATFYFTLPKSRENGI